MSYKESLINCLNIIPTLESQICLDNTIIFHDYLIFTIGFLGAGLLVIIAYIFKHYKFVKREKNE